MTNSENNGDDLCAIYVDMGTTNTRVWLRRGDEVLAFAQQQLGVRNAALDGSTTALRAELRNMIDQMRLRALLQEITCKPVCIVAAGMISSALGLAEVPYVQSPAGLPEISAGIARYQFPEINDLPFLLVPGVRSGPGEYRPGSIDQVDVMRGEETLCVGLLVLGLLKPATVVLNLGSHWKAIEVCADAKIINSWTSLSGELIQEVKGETILANALTHEWPQKVSPDWVRAGMAEQRCSGLARALFCVRLLKLEQRCPPDQRFAFLLGAFIAADLDALVARGFFKQDTRVVISGHPVTAAGWAQALKEISITATILTEQQVEAAFLAGLKRLLIAQLTTGTMSSTEPSPDTIV